MTENLESFPGAFRVVRKGSVELGDGERSVGPDMLIPSLARIPHRWSNRSEKPFRQGSSPDRSHEVAVWDGLRHL